MANGRAVILMARRKVRLADDIARVIFIDDKATVGATIGVDLKLPSGEVGTLAELQTLFGAGAATASSSVIRDHRLLRGLPLGDDHPQYTAHAQAETITGQWQWALPLWGPNGTASVPGFTFPNDTNTGIYRIAADELGASEGGVQTLRLSVTNPTGVVGLAAVNGTSLRPMRSDAAPALSQAISPTWTGTHTFSLATQFADGTEALPGVTFSADLDSGFYRIGVNTLGVTAAGALVLEFGNSYVDTKGQPRWTGRITPAVLAAGATADYAPTGLATAAVIRQATDATGSSLSGLTGGAAGRLICLINIGAAGSLTLTHDDAGSAAANRFSLVAGASLVLAIGGSVLLWYDDVSSRWRPVG